ncbi:MAG TPA: FtsW/RodA/SpoVE family cell cycle protein [Paludibacteraceae bacterium]|nr:FtsW/RodA/SpoVE family cell cycle protein [Paludibacteraceae bacterium]HOS37956.1 FtsW/RodA/SpoVE family cell cycle protein [Paludibacteraceae bacterium]HPK20429.1 FtsW/RodA/SpoVE family cell cycle protein [Paludibacteraceae bacterium]HQO48153.1 FtsW/RodA/SpoVE family cell cycle protein [Paludibacteraceae bacterium]
MDNFLKRYLKGDYVIWMVYFTLLIISVVEMFSASSQFVPKSGIMTKLIEHAVHLGLGFILLLFVHLLDSKTIKMVAYLGLALSIGLLIYTSIKGLAAADGGTRWISVVGFQFQPSEVAKLSLIIVVANWIDRAQNPEYQKKTFVYMAIIISLICGLILTENLSTSLLLFGVIILMMFIGSISFKRIMIFGGIIIGAVLLIFLVVNLIPKEKFMEDNTKENKTFVEKTLYKFKRVYIWNERIAAFVDGSKDDDLKYTINDENRQKQHAQIAIARGGAFGVMPGNSIQRNRIPEVSNDFIFAIIVEELGMLGGGIVIFLYLVLLFRAGKIAFKTETVYPSILVTGMALMIVIQALIHIGVAVGIGPVTGQPLPLISRGGTSILVNSVYFGIILGVSRSIANKENAQTLTDETETTTETPEETNLTQEPITQEL